MPVAKSYKEHRSWGPEVETLEFVYDFAKDGGAIGAYDLVKLKDRSVVRAAYMEVDTACTSGGSATVSIGPSTSVAALVAATAVASLTANASIDGASIGTTLAVAPDAVIVLDIATAALTAGKIRVRLEIAKF
jgi:hypothetical protein